MPMCMGLGSRGCKGIMRECDQTSGIRQIGRDLDPPARIGRRSAMGTACARAYGLQAGVHSLDDGGGGWWGPIHSSTSRPVPYLFWPSAKSTWLGNAPKAPQNQKCTHSGGSAASVYMGWVCEEHRCSLLLRGHQERANSPQNTCFAEWHARLPPTRVPPVPLTPPRHVPTPENRRKPPPLTDHDAICMLGAAASGRLGLEPPVLVGVQGLLFGDKRTLGCLR